jgi:hypothetical protein
VLGIRLTDVACVLVAALIVVLLRFQTPSTADHALDKAQTPAAAKHEAVFPLAGRVTINGQVPPYDQRNPLVVMPINRKNIDGPAFANRYVRCDSQGKFVFKTYSRQDGVPPGSYVLVIMKLDRGNLPFVYRGPQQLLNLYRHPDNTVQLADYPIEHADPGKTNYELSLPKASTEPVAAPRPAAMTAIR